MHAPIELYTGRPAYNLFFSKTKQMEKEERRRMLILLKKNESVLPTDPPASVAAWAFQQAEAQYGRQSADREAYIVSDFQETPIEKALSLVDGRTDPEKIKAMAAGWNTEIDVAFADALAALVATAPDADAMGRIHYSETEDRSKIYDLKKAVLALDGCFYCFAERALLVGDERCFTTLLRPEELERILDRPEDYASIEVYAK